MSATKYENALLEGRELTAESRKFRPTLFRDPVIAEVAKSVAAGRSVLLVGAPGVGKTAIVHALASQLAKGGRPQAVRILDGADAFRNRVPR